MIKMAAIEKKFKIDARSLPEFTWNADLVYFDGPLLSLFRGEDGQDVLFVWIDCDDRRNRWCIVPVERENLAAYLQKKITLRSLCLETSRVVVFHSGPTGKKSSFYLLDKFPHEYLPEYESFLEDRISTTEAKTLTKEEASDLSLGLNGELYLEDIESIPKLYQQLYSFHYGMEYLGRSAVKHAVTKLTKNWRGGISAVNLFSGLKQVTPAIHRARVKELRYNSPGKIRLNLLPTLASHIKDSMSCITEAQSFDHAQDLYRQIYRYFKDQKITGLEEEKGLVEVQLAPHQEKHLQGYVRDFFIIMKWSHYQDNFVSLEVSVLSQLRMLLAYYRRLRRLREFVVQGKLSLEGEFPV